MSQALYRKWRPQIWGDVVGQEHIIQTLKNAVAADRVGHAYIFPGPRGTGKTTTARLLAKAVNCLDPDLKNRPCDQCAHCLAVNQNRFLDLIEIDAASNTSVDDVRDLRDKINFSPNQGRFKVYIIDEVHMLSTAAFNALLKTLEEPPPHAIFILATTEAHKIPATVLSRCQRHEFRRIPGGEIVRQLRHISDVEGFDITDEALQLIARQSTGSMRDAISLLDQLASMGGHIAAGIARDVLGTATSQTVFDIIDALVSRQPSLGFDHIHQALDAGTDPRQLARQIVDYLRQVLLVQYNNQNEIDMAPEARPRLIEHSSALSVAQVLHAVKVFNQAANELRSAWNPSLPLELSFIEAMETPPSPQQMAGISQTSDVRIAAPAPLPTPKIPTAPVPRQTQAPETRSDGLSLAKIHERWGQVLDFVGKSNRSTQALLKSCTVLELRGLDLYLGFASEVVKVKMDNPETAQLIHQTLEKVYGQAIRARPVISSDSNSIPPEVESDGMVATALRLGGTIVDESGGKSRKKQSKTTS